MVRHGRRSFLLVAAIAALALVVSLRPSLAQDAGPGVLATVTFTAYSPLSSNDELARRLLHPLNRARLPELLAKMGKSSLSDQPIDLSQEKFAVYLPASPAKGLGLIVFVAPWNDARLPDGWAPVLDQFGYIFVSALHSGNDQSVLGRREPLALLAEQNIAQHYAIDPTRVFVAGFSGGAHVALRLALAYPDIFRGALLNAGSDPIGTHDVPLPPRDLFFRFQSGSRLFFVTGARDTTRLSYDAVSKRSLHDWCMFNIDDHTSDSDHVVANGTALMQALTFLVKDPAPDPALPGCRAGLESQLSAALDQVESLIAAGKRDDARALLAQIDTRFGGLAAPKSVALFEKLQ